jgi:hypothetical protein
MQRTNKKVIGLCLGVCAVIGLIFVAQAELKNPKLQQVVKKIRANATAEGNGQPGPMSPEERARMERGGEPPIFRQ